MMTMMMMRGVAILAVAALLLLTSPSFGKTVRIVAIGASNTQGFYAGREAAYPAQLQKLLKQKGINAEVINAGVPFDTTAAMLKRIDSAVPQGTDIVILQPGGNDRRFFVSREQRAANIAEMERRLHARGIKVVVYDEDIPWRYYSFDFIHLTREGHAMIAAALLPRITAIAGQPRAQVPQDKTPRAAR
jgi:acyl-CoA thioesterase I